MNQTTTDLLGQVFRKHNLDLPALNRYSRPGAEDAFGCSIPSIEAVKLWKALRAESSKTQYYPVLLENAEAFEVDAKDERSFQALVQAALSRKPGDVFAARRAELDDPNYFDALHGSWPEGWAGEKINEDLELVRGLKKKDRFLALFPADACWKVHAWLGYGGWNACPDVEQQVCIQHYWYEKWGAELVVSAGDFLEFFVARPPTTQAEALALAEEQCLYCEDIVVQGTQTLEALAANLYKGHYWFFWWD